VARLVLLVLQELRVATKAKVLELRGDLVKVKINTATISNRATVEEETLGEVGGVEVAGDTLGSTNIGVHYGFGKKKPGVQEFGREHDLLEQAQPLIRSLIYALHSLSKPAAHVQRFGCGPRARYMLDLWQKGW
jgi:hypothetical protein